MRYITFFFLTAFIMVRSSGVYGKTIEEYIGEAESKQESGEIEQAIHIMEKALGEYPDNSAVFGYLGAFTGIQAGAAFETGDLSIASELTTKTFELLDKAIELDSNNAFALFNRGMMGISVPGFFGKQGQGIEDLEKLLRLFKVNPNILPDAMRLTALDLLATGYDNKAETRNSLASDVPATSDLEEKLKNDPDNADLLYELAMAYGVEADAGYDERIYEDATFRTNIAFEIVKLLDKAVKNAPDNMKYRLDNGSTSVMMPNFVNKLDSGIENLNVVLKSSAPDSLKAEARYWLGYAYQKKASMEWITVISDYPETKAAAMTFEQITPSVKRFDQSKHSDPCVAIDFILGFLDNLAPQTSVWIEDARGRFVKTVYISGFSGYAKEKQINLPIWSESSKFADVDGVTAASIDLGHHLYIWDMKDSNGKRVKSGKYTVKIETSYWPSMKYQSTAVSVTTGNKENGSIIEEGNCIPFLEAVYYP